jgi:hypothetical protein
MERDAAKVHASGDLPGLAPDSAPLQSVATVAPIGNQDAQRAALQSLPLPEPEPASRVVTVHLDPQQPWLATAEGEPGDDAVAAELYGGEQSVAIESFTTPALPIYGIPAARRYVVEPAHLRQPYRDLYQALVANKQSLLDTELDSDFQQIVEWLDMPELFYPSIEPRVLAILEKWGLQTFRPAPPPNPRHRGRSVYLDKLLLKLGTKSKDVGLLATVWTSYYDMMFNHFHRDDELRRIRDTYSISFVGEGAQEEVSFGGVLWDRVKSGAVRDNIVGYFGGLKDAAVGLVTGLAHMIRHPIDTLEGLGKLPGTLQTLWQHRGELWDKFVNASEEEKGRYIGRFFGEIEVILATAGGAKAAGGLPKLELAMPLMAEAVALGPALSQGGAITVDLAKLGQGAAGLSMMSQALDKTSGGASAAEDLRSNEGRGRRTVEEDIAKEERLVDEATHIPPESDIQWVLPTARGAAVEVALIEKLGLNKLVNWFKTLDGISGGTYRLVKEGTRYVHEYVKPKGFSVKSTWKTDFGEIDADIDKAVTALEDFKIAERTESGQKVRVRGLSERRLEFVFDAQARFANEAELVTFMKRMTKSARARGVNLRWWVDKGGELWEGFRYYEDEAKLWSDVE